MVDEELLCVKYTSSVALRQLLPLEKPLVRAASPQDKAGGYYPPLQWYIVILSRESSWGRSRINRRIFAPWRIICVNIGGNTVFLRPTKATTEYGSPHELRSWLSPKILRMYVALSQYTSHAQNDKYGKDIDRQIEC